MEKTKPTFPPTIYLTIALVLITLLITCITRLPNQESGNFNGERAYKDIEYQLSLGPRIPGSEGHRAVVDWLGLTLNENGWETHLQTSELMGHPITNVIARRGVGEPWIILGAHFDSRIMADQDSKPENRLLPVPGANDGASGVALLIELARDIPKELPFEIWLVFFDAEDNGNINGWDWILGSRVFVNVLEDYPDYMILVDMVGDKDLNIYMEKNSNPELMQDIWEIAASLGYSNYFIPRMKYAIHDDHIPFVRAGITSVDIIDYDYPYWHTIEDTLDKISPNSLSIVGNTILAWLDTIQ
jgi:glutaminyl-peptide cyclotransferase